MLDLFILLRYILTNLLIILALLIGIPWLVYQYMRIQKSMISIAAAACILAVSPNVAFADSMGDHIRTIKCPRSDWTDPYVVWAGIKGERQVKQFLKDNLARTGSVYAFAVWLACQQGMNIQVADRGFYFRNGYVGDRRLDKSVILSFKPKTPGSFPWQRGLFEGWGAFAAEIKMYIDKENDIFDFRIGYSVK